MINVTNHGFEEIATCVDQNPRIEMIESGRNPSEPKVELWQKDAFQLIHTQCITARAYRLTTVRGLTIADSQFNKEDAHGETDADDGTLKGTSV
jgi:hypothetical protein